MSEKIFDWAVEGGGETVFRQVMDGQEQFVKKSSHMNFDENDNEVWEQHSASFNSFSEYWSDFIKNPTWYRCRPIFVHPNVIELIRLDLNLMLLKKSLKQDQDEINEWKKFIENKSNVLLEEKLVELIGSCPDDSSEYKHKRRFHQGWWRTFVLSHDQGNFYENGKAKTVCNRINNGENENFLSDNIFLTVTKTIEERMESKVGIIEEGRLFNNLLSSQPLTFNFFGEFKINTDLATRFFKKIFPEITEVNEVCFEYPYKENYTKDHSAFDVAIPVKSGQKKGLIGFECKYTDSFSFRPSNAKVNYGDKGSKNHDNYKQIFDKSKSHFINDYYEYVRDNDLNQLFRNELIGQSLFQNQHFDFIQTGLFCDPEDEKALNSGKKLQRMITEPTKFRILTFDEFIEIFQRLDIQPKERELSMMLWARYCGYPLSNSLFKTRNK